ncbi:hypothetical protein [Microbacterium sp. H1-D42]|uniref:hypothetical protein n=1 Tax=Microbacterium sp. H1-D42 TaxID=2925844 RepID=UPI001F53BFF1|nr:hypothetical protein [Microbacterium sp. H1-D42]UNK69573.1 hypothetical protein MNR00_10325 [Microbacterium sp. H1-D42]
MITTYRVLAYIICALVAVQAAAHAWASAGLSAYIFAGGAIDLSAPPAIPEFLGIMVHGMNGMYVIPLVAIALLVVAFLAKTPKAVPLAVTVVVLVALQITLGMLSHSVTFLALLHGLNALLLFGTALVAARTVGRSAASAPAVGTATAASVRG